MAGTTKPSFHDVVFKTRRLQRVVDCYKTVVGVNVQFQDDNAWTTNNEANHRLAFLMVPGLEDDPNKVKHNGFRTNPIGTLFDPAKVLDAHTDGRPFAELQSAIRKGEFLPIPGLGLPTEAAGVIRDIP